MNHSSGYESHFLHLSFDILQFKGVHIMVTYYDVIKTFEVIFTLMAIEKL